MIRSLRRDAVPPRVQPKPGFGVPEPLDKRDRAAADKNNVEEVSCIRFRSSAGVALAIPIVPRFKTADNAQAGASTALPQPFLL